MREFNFRQFLLLVINEISRKAHFLLLNKTGQEINRSANNSSIYLSSKFSGLKKKPEEFLLLNIIHNKKKSDHTIKRFLEIRKKV